MQRDGGREGGNEEMNKRREIKGGEKSKKIERTEWQESKEGAGE